jgi:hypothetical protein
MRALGHSVLAGLTENWKGEAVAVAACQEAWRRKAGPVWFAPKETTDASVAIDDSLTLGLGTHFAATPLP